jgi:hypothetical protein
MQYKRLLLVGMLSLIALLSEAQKKYKIMPGENVKEVIPRTELYAYDQFQKGTIYFKSGVQSTALLNYSFLFGEFLFADRNGDTMALSNLGEVKIAVIENDFYYYAGNSSFVKKGTAIGKVILATAVFFKTGDKQRIGAYGTIDNGGRETYSTFDPPSGPRIELMPQIILTLSRSKALFMGTHYNLFVPVTKKNLYSFYPEKQRQLNEYMKQKRTDLFSRKNVIDLIIFMNSL